MIDAGANKIAPLEIEELNVLSSTTADTIETQPTSPTEISTGSLVNATKAAKVLSDKVRLLIALISIIGTGMVIGGVSSGAYFGTLSTTQSTLLNTLTTSILSLQSTAHSSNSMSTATTTTSSTSTASTASVSALAGGSTTLTNNVFLSSISTASATSTTAASATITTPSTITTTSTAATSATTSSTTTVSTTALSATTSMTATTTATPTTTFSTTTTTTMTTTTTTTPSTTTTTTATATTTTATTTTTTATTTTTTTTTPTTTRWNTLIDSVILNTASTQALFTLIGWSMNTNLTLLYRGTRDGFSVNTFHARCDLKPKTLVVLRSTLSFIFGGYTDAQWSSPANAHQVSDANAFIWSLNNSFRSNIKSSHTTSAITVGACCGPTFGPNPSDIYISSNSNTNNISDSNFGNAYTLPNGFIFNTNASRNYLAGSFKFITNEIEVFQR